MKSACCILSLFLTATLFVTGCAHQRIITDDAHPDIAMTVGGIFTWRGEFVDPDDLPELLKDAGYRRRDTVSIHVPSDLKGDDYKRCYYVMRLLVQSGFSRPILVKEKRSYSEAPQRGRTRKR